MMDSCTQVEAMSMTAFGNLIKGLMDSERAGGEPQAQWTVGKQVRILT